mmetsp:Transcript_40465/g.121920  ORF Transcript_40465/g.121920 Transcript_40465/m.121920 type:complete len:231 (-) Transcript_40465:247-939(-)
MDRNGTRMSAEATVLKKSIMLGVASSTNSVAPTSAPTSTFSTSSSPPPDSIPDSSSLPPFSGSSRRAHTNAIARRFVATRTTPTEFNGSIFQPLLPTSTSTHPSRAFTPGPAARPVIRTALSRELVVVCAPCGTTLATYAYPRAELAAPTPPSSLDARIAPTAARPGGRLEASRYSNPPDDATAKDARYGTRKPRSSDHQPMKGLEQKDANEKAERMKPYCSFVPPLSRT